MATLKAFFGNWKQNGGGARQPWVELPCQLQMAWCLYPEQCSLMRVLPQTYFSPWEHKDLSGDGPLRRPSGASDHISVKLRHVSELAGLYSHVWETALVSLQGQFLHEQSIDKSLYSVTLMSETIFLDFMIFWIYSAYFKHYILFLSAFLKWVKCWGFVLADVFRITEKLVFILDDTFLPFPMLFLLLSSYMSQ